MKYFVYILKCSDDSYYVGVTNGILRRMHEHESGLHENSYVYSRRPFQLVYQIGFDDIRAAIDFEKKIKGWSRKKKEALMNNNWDEIKSLAVCKNEANSKNRVV